MAGESTVTTSEKLTLNGSCHCGAIKFKVDNAEPNKATKCNCSICNITGTISVMVADGDLKLVLKDGTNQAITYKNSRENLVPELSTYTMTEPTDNHQVYHHYCGKCGIHCFLTGYLDFMGGSFNCANLRTLNLKEHGKDIKVYTGPGQVQYCDGLANTWATRKEEPFPGGAW